MEIRSRQFLLGFCIKLPVSSAPRDYRFIPENIFLNKEHQPRYSTPRRQPQFPLKSEVTYRPPTAAENEQFEFLGFRAAGVSRFQL